MHDGGIAIERTSMPAAKPSPPHAASTANSGEQRDNRPVLEERDAAQSIVERGKSRACTNGWKSSQENVRSKEDAGENPHRHHGQRHEPTPFMVRGSGESSTRQLKAKGSKERNSPLRRKETRRNPRKGYAEREARKARGAAFGHQKISRLTCAARQAGWLFGTGAAIQ